MASPQDMESVWRNFNPRPDWVVPYDPISGFREKRKRRRAAPLFYQTSFSSLSGILLKHILKFCSRVISCQGTRLGQVTLIPENFVMLQYLQFLSDLRLT